MRNTDQIKKELTALPAQEPFIWRLKLNSQEYELLKEYLIKSKSEKGKDNLISSNSRLIIAYLAEWFKREYKSENRTNDIGIEASDLRKIWENSGWDIPSLIYKFSDGSNSWSYSTYVLGGLSLRKELSRNDKGKFLRDLCSIYHGKKDSLDNSESFALAFQESLKNKGSLFYYFQELFNGHLPFAPEDIKENPLVFQFKTAIETANLEALKNKFDLVSGFIYNPENSRIHPLYYLNPGPEDHRNFHDYISYARLKAWGFMNPELISSLNLSLRFLDGTKIVGETSLTKPLKTWFNSGWEETGFLSVGKSKIYCKEIPQVKYDRIEAFLSSTEHKHNIGSWGIPDYYQLWLKDEETWLWTDKKSTGNPTVIFFKNPLKPIETSEWECLEVVAKGFHKPYETINLIWIQSEITLTDGQNKYGPFYNFLGKDSIDVKEYNSIIDYFENSTIKYINEEGKEYNLKCIFKKEDIILRRENFSGQELKVTQESPASVEFKSDNSRYTIWDENHFPPYGKISVRIVSQGKNLLQDLIYLPSMSADYPIERDLSNHILHYKEPNGNIKALEDKKNLDYSCQIPESLSLTMEISEESRIILKVYRPWKFRQIIFDQTQAFKAEEEIVSLSYLFKNRSVIRELNENGFWEYNCNKLTGFFKNLINPIMSWRKSYSILANTLDEAAPSWLHLVIGKNPPITISDNLLYWNYMKGSKPEEIEEIPNNLSKGLIFEDGRNPKSLLYSYPKQADTTKSMWDVKKVEKTTATPLDCFKIAFKYRTYFFLMRPLDPKNLNLENDILTPLSNEYKGVIPLNVELEIKRMIEELNLI